MQLTVILSDKQPVPGLRTSPPANNLGMFKPLKTRCHPLKYSVLLKRMLVTGRDGDVFFSGLGIIYSTSRKRLMNILFSLKCPGSSNEKIKLLNGLTLVMIPQCSIVLFPSTSFKALSPASIVTAAVCRKNHLTSYPSK